MKIITKNKDSYILEPIGSNDRHNWAVRYATWINDEEVTKYLYQGTIPTSVEKCKALYDILTNEDNVVFNIIAEGTGSPVGIVGIFNIYWPSKVGEFRILLGETQHWGKGLGQACLEKMNEIAFERLGLYKFWLGFNGNHGRAEGAYAKSGFQHECIIKRHHFKNGVYNDLVRMCMFKEDYEVWKKSKQD